jgi:class 3 adenylate cyclase
VEKFIGDAVVAFFGAPVAGEDDPERAVRAALAIRDWIAEEGTLQVRVAVNTGEALVRLGARPESGEGMAAGDVVNTAARLRSAAPANGILVGETTYRPPRNGSNTARTNRSRRRARGAGAGVGSRRGAGPVRSGKALEEQRQRGSRDRFVTTPWADRRAQ